MTFYRSFPFFLFLFFFSSFRLGNHYSNPYKHTTSHIRMIVSLAKVEQESLSKMCRRAIKNDLKMKRKERKDRKFSCLE